MGSRPMSKDLRRAGRMLRTVLERPPFLRGVSSRSRRPDCEKPMHADAPPRPLISRPAGPIAGRARVPGDKSISHRALMLGGVALGTSEIHGLLEGEDVLRTAAAMRLLGAEIELHRTPPGPRTVA